MPLDIFLCGYVKGHVFRATVHDIGTLCHVNRSNLKCDEKMLTHTRAELEYEFYVVRVTRRSHVEED